MKIILNLLIFCLVLFIYLHVYFHLKTSDDLEVYEIEQPSKDKLEEICDLRQPVIFDYPNDSLIESCTRNNIRDTYGAFEVKIRDVTSDLADDEELYIPLSYASALSAVNEDKNSKYLVENNDDFLDETGMVKLFRYNDSSLFHLPTSTSNLCKRLKDTSKSTISVNFSIPGGNAVKLQFRINTFLSPLISSSNESGSAVKV